VRSESQQQLTQKKRILSFSLTKEQKAYLLTFIIFLSFTLIYAFLRFFIWNLPSGVRIASEYLNISKPLLQNIAYPGVIIPCLLFGVFMAYFCGKHGLPKPKLYVIILRGVLLIFIFDIAGMYQSMPHGIMGAHEDHLLLIANIIRYTSIGLGIYALWNVNFAFLPLFLFVSYWMIGNLINGHVRFITDWANINEIGMICVVMYFLVSVVAHHNAKAKELLTSSENKISPVELVTLFAIAIHMATYFYSGILKISLDGGFFSWVFQNKTYYYLFMSQEMNRFAIMDFDIFRKLSLFTMMNMYKLTNSFVLLIQLAAIFAFFRVLVLRILTLLYDFMHLIIFFASGLFFWKWIAFNSTIVYALRYIKRIPMLAYLLCTAVILIAPLAYHVFFLGWYDTKEGNILKVQAITDNGKVYNVPSNYFLYNSYAMSDTRFNRGFNGYLPDNRLQATRHYSTMVNALHGCGNKPNGVAMHDPKESKKTLRKLVRMNQAFVLQHVDNNGRFPYDFYMFHAWSNPARYTSFYKLDKRKIKGFLVSADAICIDDSHYKVHNIVMRKSQMYINVSDIPKLVHTT